CVDQDGRRAGSLRSASAAFVREPEAPGRSARRPPAVPAGGARGGRAGSAQPPHREGGGHRGNGRRVRPGRGTAGARPPRGAHAARPRPCPRHRRRDREGALMLTATVVGNVWSTRRLAEIPNGAFLEVEAEGSGTRLVAFDVLGSGVGERVLVAQGSVAAAWFPGKAPPIDALIIGSIDEPASADAAGTDKKKGKAHGG